MKIIKLIYWFYFIGLLATIIYIDKQIGFSIQTKNNITEVSSGTHPIIIINSIVIFVLCCFIPQKTNNTHTIITSKKIRRIVAFYINFIVSLICVAGITSLIPLIIEYQRVKVFQWSFTRNYIISSDVFVGFPVIILSIILMLVFNSLPWFLGKQNFGEYLCNTKTIFIKKEQPTLNLAFKRSFAGFASCLILPITLVIGHNSEYQYWQDKWCDTKVIQL
jgi:hypothetical protein